MGKKGTSIPSPYFEHRKCGWKVTHGNGNRLLDWVTGCCVRLSNMSYNTIVYKSSYKSFISA